ncbi:helix-turn-helix transcriptional regulator [Spirillospora sp. NBC_00431]
MTRATLDVLEVLVGITDPVYGLVVINRTNRPGGTVYPILARLEQVGWVHSRWADDDDRARGPRRRYYFMSDEGQEQAKQALLDRTGWVEPAARDDGAPLSGKTPSAAPRSPAGTHVPLPASADSAASSFAWRLRRLRESAGNPSLRELAEITYYSPGALAEAFAGRVLPSAAITRAIAHALNGDIADWDERRERAVHEQRAANLRLGFGNFYLHAWSIARSLARRADADGVDLEDLVQDVMVEAIRQWDKLSGHPSPEKWIYRVISRQLRRMNDISPPQILPLEAGDPHEAPDEDSESAGLNWETGFGRGRPDPAGAGAQVPDIADVVTDRLYVQELRGRAPTKQIELAMVQYLLGYSPAEIADNLGFSSPGKMQDRLRLFGQALTSEHRSSTARPVHQRNRHLQGRKRR